MTTSTLSAEAVAAVPRQRRLVAPSVYLGIAACGAVMAVMAAPLVFSLLASIRSRVEASAGSSYLPRTFSLESYLKVIEYQAGIGTYLGNSIGVALMTIAACLALAAPAGFGLARFSPRGKEIAFIVLLTPMMIPYQALLTPLYLNFARFGLIDSRIGLAIIHTILQLPFSIFLMRHAFEAIPREIEEAAMIDGCSPLKQLTRIFLPLATPALVTVGLFAFITSWNEFLAALVFMNRESSFTVPILLVSVRTGDHGAIDWGALQASIVMSVIPCLVVYVALQRYYISGLLSGSVKS
jgi:multiple sugar transport system permease protein